IRRPGSTQRAEQARRLNALLLLEVRRPALGVLDALVLGQQEDVARQLVALGVVTVGHLARADGQRDRFFLALQRDGHLQGAVFHVQLGLLGVWLLGASFVSDEVLGP